MAWIHPAAEEYRRQRWMRPDAERWLRPDAGRWLSAQERDALRQAPTFDRKYCEPPSASERVAAHRDRTARLRAISLIRAAQVQIAMIKHLLALQRKANFNSNQPRVPAGSPDGGQWTSEGGGGEGINDPRVVSDATPDNEWQPGARYAQAAGSPRDRADGHHKLPVAHYERLPLSSETRKVFDDAKTGRLHVHGHQYDVEHRAYNRATKELMDRFMQEKDIKPEQMTPAQARELLKAIDDSPDRRIRRYNMKIQFREMLYQFRSGRIRGTD